MEQNSDEILEILAGKKDTIKEDLWNMNLWYGDGRQAKCMYHSIQWGIPFKLKQSGKIKKDCRRYLIGRH